MTGNQRKKRVNAASLVGCNSHERYTVKKKKKVEISEPDLDTIHNPLISLEWDTKKKIVVSKRDQIAICQRHLIPFAESSFHDHEILADVVSVPREIFELDNLSEVLSYEAWRGLLTENERKRLSHFLPKEAELDTLVQDLLSGENFHFGNPLLTWSTSLCIGELHPDNVIHEEKSLKTRNNSYHSFLQKYHNDMIGTLQLWKEKWDGSEDPDVDFAQIIMRSRENLAEKFTTPEWYDSEGNLDTTPDSGTNSEKAPSSDNRDARIVSEDFERRGVNSDIDKNLAGQVEKLHKYNIEHGDGTKYMSYVKVSKQQHERVKHSMKHAGNNMQPRSLSNVLGIIDSLNVQPFERFEEEEKKKLQDYWLKLANRDIYEGFAYRRERHLSRQKLIQSLETEVRQKFESTHDDENGPHCNLIGHLIDRKEETTLTINHEIVKQSDDSLLEQSDDEIEQEEEKNRDEVLCGKPAVDVNELEHVDLPYNVSVQDHLRQPVSVKNRSVVGIPVPESSNPLVLRHGIGPGNVNPPIKEPQTDDSLVVPMYARNLNRVISPASQGGSFTSLNEVWPVGVPGSYYASSQELTLRQSRFIQEQPLRMFDPRQEKETGKDMFVDQSQHPSFFSYSNHDRNEMLQSMFKAQTGLPYHPEPKHPSLDFQMEPSQYHRPSIHLDSKLYMHQTLPETIFSDGGRYAMHRQGHVGVNISDWPPENSVRSAASSQAHVNSGDLNQNWYTGDNCHQVLWPAFENVNQSLGIRNSDQSLFTVLSECNTHRPRPGFVGSSEMFVHGGNSGELGEAAPASSVQLQAANSSNYANGWIGIPQQNSGTSKSFVRPWH